MQMKGILTNQRQDHQTSKTKHVRQGALQPEANTTRSGTCRKLWEDQGEETEETHVETPVSPQSNDTKDTEESKTSTASPSITFASKQNLLVHGKVSQELWSKI